MPEQTQIPRVLWAQQRENVLLTITVPDIEKVDVKFEETSVAFHGQPASSNAKDKTVYAVKIDLYEKIDPDVCKYENVGQKYWQLLLKKKDVSAAFWPRLTKDKARLHWLQTDFDHWKDEDESDDEKAGLGGNFQDMFGAGMGDMPDMGEGSDDEAEDDDEDDEEGSSVVNGSNGTSEQSKTSSNEQSDNKNVSATQASSN